MQNRPEARPMGTSNAAFVGRRREVGLFERQLEAAVGGQLRVLLVSGEPGIGKTRLLTHAAEEARRRGAAVLHGGASEAEGMPPYLPFLEAFGRYVRRTNPTLLREDVGVHGRVLAAIVPELSDHLGDLPPGYALPPEQARLRLFQAVADWLAAIGDREPLVLLLDDLHWTDPASLDLLVHLPRHQPSARLLILGAYRQDEGEQNPALQRAIDELTRQRALVTVRLDPLSREEADELAVAHLEAPVAPELSRLLYTQSEGNPFFAEELLADWLESGTLTLQSGEWTPVAIQDSLPTSLVRAIQQRFTRLPTELVDHLRVAAIIGRSFEASLLAEVVDRDVEAVDDVLQAALRAGLTRSSGPETFTFKHDKVRECLYMEVSSGRRQRLHRRIGQALEGREDRRSSQNPADLAFHFARSGDRAAGVVYSVQAAEHAMVSHAALEAVAHYETALALMDRADPERGRVLLGLGQAAMQAGHEDQAARAFEEARRTLSRTGDPVAAARASHGLGMVRWRQGALQEAQLALDAALVLLGDHTGPETVQVLVDLGSLLNAHAGRHADGLAVGRRALDLAHALGDGRLEVAAGRTVGQLTAWGNDIAAGIQILERALARATAVDDLAEAAEICGVLANLYFATFQVERSRQVTLMRLDFARQCHDLYALRHVHSWLAELALQQGKWSETERLLEQAQGVAERLAGDEPLAVLYRVRGRMAAYRERHEEALHWYEAAAAIGRRKGPQHAAWYLGPLALSYLDLGKTREALAVLTALEAAVAQLPPGGLPTAPALTALVEIAVRIGDGERATLYAKQLSPFEGRMFLSLVDTALAAVEAGRHRWTEAEVYLRRAERDARQAGFRPLLLGILTERAGLELGRGGPDASRRARTALEEGLALCDELGLDGKAALLREQLSRLPQPTGPSAGVPLPAGLSRREVEVLRFVAAGRSNRQIAHELHMSEKTVEKHLTGILNKTASENRAAAAAFAIRSGLA